MLLSCCIRCDIGRAGYLPLRNIWPQFCRNIRKASSQTELLALITKFLCEEWKPEPTTQVRCFMWGKFLKNLARFRRPRCGVPIGQLVPWLPYWMGDDYNETRVVGLRQGRSRHARQYIRNLVNMHMICYTHLLCSVQVCACGYDVHLRTCMHIDRISSMGRGCVKPRVRSPQTPRANAPTTKHERRNTNCSKWRCERGQTPSPHQKA